EPAQRETWTAVITGPDAQRAAAEMVATLYDASLDAFQPHAWANGFGVFRRDHSMLARNFENQLKHLSTFRHGWSRDGRDGTLIYPRLKLLSQEMVPLGIPSRRGRMLGLGGMGGGESYGANAMMMRSAARAMAEGMAMESARAFDAVADKAAVAGQGRGQDGGAPPEATPQLDLDSISARTNLEETAFFFPHVLAGEDGTVRLEFTMPEALTKWKFLGFAHDAELRGGLLSDTVVTSKDLMVQPNAPRFLRAGDQIEFTVKVT